MSAPRWDDMADWDEYELLDAYGELRDQHNDDLDDLDTERKFLWVRDEILRRLAQDA